MHSMSYYVFYLGTANEIPLLGWLFNKGIRTRNQKHQNTNQIKGSNFYQAVSTRYMQLKDACKAIGTVQAPKSHLFSSGTFPAFAYKQPGHRQQPVQSAGTIPCFVNANGKGLS